MVFSRVRVVWLCAWFTCLSLTQALDIQYGQGWPVIVAGSIPGPVSMFEQRRDCELAIARSGQKCETRILARPMRFRHVSTAQDARSALDMLQTCTSVETVEEGANKCAGRPAKELHRLCTLMSPRVTANQQISATFCKCSKKMNFDFSGFDITTYPTQQFACVTEEDFEPFESDHEEDAEEEEELSPELTRLAKTKAESEPALTSGRVLYGVLHNKYATHPQDRAPLSLFEDVETCQRATAERADSCVPFSIVKSIPIEDYMDAVQKDKELQEDPSPRKLMYPFAESSYMYGYCKGKLGAAVAYYMPVTTLEPDLKAEPQWFVCPLHGDIKSNSFSDFIRRVKELPETVILTRATDLQIARQPISLQVFAHEQAEFEKRRESRNRNAVEFPLQSTDRDSTDLSFFIERVTLEVAHPKLHMWGDIHGSIHSLLRTLQQIGLKDDWTLVDPRDVLIFLGDYVDRGDYGPEVLFVLMKLFNMNPKSVILVRGNHESLSTAESYGFGSQLRDRFSLTEFPERMQIYSLFDLLPAAVYLRDPKYDPTSDAPSQFYMFAHGGIQISFDPSRFLAHAPDAPIVRAVFANWSPLKQLVSNVIRWADIGNKAVETQAGFNMESSQTAKLFISNAATDDESEDVVLKNKKKILETFGAKSDFSRLETVGQPGFMWNDMTIDEYPSEKGLRLGLIAAARRGYVLPQTMVENYLRLNSIKAIFRAHQHNNEVDNFLTKIQKNYGLFAVYPTMEHKVTKRHDYISKGWFTDLVPPGLSSAYTLNSSPNSGLDNNFDSYVILDFNTDDDPVLSHRFCQLSDHIIDEVRQDNKKCWYQSVDDDTESINPTDMLYGVDHGKAVSLFASLEECEMATQWKIPCVPYSSAVNIDAVTVGQMYLQMTVVDRITYTDLTYPRVTADTISTVCSLPSESVSSQLFFPHSSTDFIRQWFVCLKPGLVASQSFSEITARVKNAEETIELKKKKKPLVSYPEFENQYKLFQSNRLQREQECRSDGFATCSDTDSTLYVERIPIDDANAKIHIIGSLDGSIHSLIRILNRLGVKDDWTLKNSDDHVVFLGNYLVGSGYGMESLYVIMSLFNMNRDKVILLRGAEETNAVEFEKEMKNKFKLKKDESKIFREISESLPVAVFITDPATVGSEEPQFMLFTSSGIQLSWNPSEFLKLRPSSRLIRTALCDRDTDTFVRNVMRWGHIDGQKHMKITDDSKTKSKQVWILNQSGGLRGAEADQEELTRHLFAGGDYSKLESTAMCGFMFNDFYEAASSTSKSSPRFVVASTKHGMLVSKELLRNYMRQNQVRSVFKTHHPHGVTATTQLLRTAFGTAPLFSSQRPSDEAVESESSGSETDNGWISEKAKVAQSPVWVLTSASESGSGFHFDSFATLNLQRNELTQHHCSLPEPTKRSRSTRPKFATCWPTA